MNFDTRGILDAAILLRNSGIDKNKGPIEVEETEFGSLLESDEAYDHSLNNHYGKGEGDYFHTAKYDGFEFVCLTDEPFPDPENEIILKTEPKANFLNLEDRMKLTKNSVNLKKLERYHNYGTAFFI